MRKTRRSPFFLMDSLDALKGKDTVCPDGKAPSQQRDEARSRRVGDRGGQQPLRGRDPKVMASKLWTTSEPVI